MFTFLYICVNMSKHVLGTNTQDWSWRSTCHNDYNHDQKVEVSEFRGGYMYTHNSFVHYSIRMICAFIHYHFCNLIVPCCVVFLHFEQDLKIIVAQIKLYSGICKVSIYFSELIYFRFISIYIYVIYREWTRSLFLKLLRRKSYWQFRKLYYSWMLAGIHP